MQRKTNAFFTVLALATGLLATAHADSGATFSATAGYQSIDGHSRALIAVRGSLRNASEEYLLVDVKTGLGTLASGESIVSYADFEFTPIGGVWMAGERYMATDPHHEYALGRLKMLPNRISRELAVGKNLSYTISLLGVEFEKSGMLSEPASMGYFIQAAVNAMGYHYIDIAGASDDSFQGIHLAEASGEAGVGWFAKTGHRKGFGVRLGVGGRATAALGGARGSKGVSIASDHELFAKLSLLAPNLFDAAELTEIFGKAGIKHLELGNARSEDAIGHMERVPFFVEIGAQVAF